MEVGEGVVDIWVEEYLLLIELSGVLLLLLFLINNISYSHLCFHNAFNLNICLKGSEKVLHGKDT